jgi:hypothetical protein
MQPVAGEPAVAEGGGVGASEQHRARLHQAVGHRAAGLRNEVSLRRQAVGGGVAGLVHVDLGGDGHAGQRAGIVAAGDRLIDRPRLRQHVLRPVFDDGVERGIDLLQPRDGGVRDFGRGHLARMDQGGDLRRRQTPEFGCGSHAAV